jgi:hypothetical protein
MTITDYLQAFKSKRTERFFFFFFFCLTEVRNISLDVNILLCLPASRIARSPYMRERKSEREETLEKGGEDGGEEEEGFRIFCL